jgi:hypothetical protein
MVVVLRTEQLIEYAQVHRRHLDIANGRIVLGAKPGLNQRSIGVTFTQQFGSVNSELHRDPNEPLSSGATASRAPRGRRQCSESSARLSTSGRINGSTF